MVCGGAVVADALKRPKCRFLRPLLLGQRLPCHRGRDAQSVASRDSPARNGATMTSDHFYHKKGWWLGDASCTAEHKDMVQVGFRSAQLRDSSRIIRRCLWQSRVMRSDVLLMTLCFWVSQIPQARWFFRQLGFSGTGQSDNSAIQITKHMALSEHLGYTIKLATSMGHMVMNNYQIRGYMGSWGYHSFWQTQNPCLDMFRPTAVQSFIALTAFATCGEISTSSLACEYTNAVLQKACTVLWFYWIYLGINQHWICEHGIKRFVSFLFSDNSQFNSSGPRVLNILIHTQLVIWTCPYSIRDLDDAWSSFAKSRQLGQGQGSAQPAQPAQPARQPSAQCDSS